MPNPPRRRHTDRTTTAPPASADATAWVLRCAQRIAEIEPQVGPEEAMQIARTMHDTERTGVMDPVAAADFVAEQMRRADRLRFERRTTLAAAAVKDPAR